MRSFVVLLLLAVTACAPKPVLMMPVPAVVDLIPPHVPDRVGWAEDIRAAMQNAKVSQTPESVCAVIAVIEQESGFSADPVVAGLAESVRTGLHKNARETLGIAGPWLADQLLKATPLGSDQSFGQKLAKVRSERDVDLLFREMADTARETFPVATGAAHALSLFKIELDIDQLNPITTIGSMQVSERWARERAHREVRDELYTRAGGLHYGVARLFYAETGYSDVRFLFADYNAGPFASRNAALQRQLARVLDMTLAEDGDIWSYDRYGRRRSDMTASLRALLSFGDHLAPELSEATIRSDAKREKDADFSRTRTFQAVKKHYQRRYGDPAYAIMPRVKLHSVKMSQSRTTEWFASAVNKRYERCVSRMSGAEAQNKIALAL